ncbi:MAG TPA: hypothetical protein DIW80_07485 [Gordonia polyisoprenivorans]|nr:hypothetical protein CJJ17_15490 [Gordonia polyisoprenivorans]HCS57085.1 hypothetical protein [Gordonia polyisoprenivorans]
MSQRGDQVCRCGHPRSAHDHLRAGTDCALCGASGCSRFRRPRFWHRRGPGAADGSAPGGGESLGAQPVNLWEVQRRKRIGPDRPGEEKIG